MKTNRVRFAPSPTGFLHLGNARSAILNWLFVMKYGGEFVLRIDDTDLLRSDIKYTKSIIDDLSWLGITWSKYFEQSKRSAIYNDAINKLKASSRLYPCYETESELQEKKIIQRKMGLPPIYDRESLLNKNITKTDKVHWRFLLENREESWDDMIRGPITYHAKNLSDPILIREDGTIVYTLASVVDDAEMAITNVIRGEDHVTNTVVQIQLFRALYGEDFILPQFAHFPYVLDTDGHGLSKRIGSLSISNLRSDGILPISIIDVIESLGTGRAIEKHSSINNIIERFDIYYYGKSPARLNIDDIIRTNKRYIADLSFNELSLFYKIQSDYNLSETLWNAIKENISSFSEIEYWLKVCNSSIDIQTIENIKGYHNFLPETPWNHDSWNEFINNIINNTDRKGKDLMQDLRMAITGKTSGPKMCDIFYLIKPEIVCSRL